MATNKVDYARKARIHLSKADPILARIIAEVGALGIQPRRERFQALARAIIFQQLAGAAANAIYGRFVAFVPRRGFSVARTSARQNCPRAARGRSL